MRRSPQDKKALSYARDRRNVYGENDKSSRKNIPLARRRVHNANRHADRQQLLEAAGPIDAERAEAAEDRLRSRRPKSWRKSRTRLWDKSLRSSGCELSAFQLAIRPGHDDEAWHTTRICQPLPGKLAACPHASSGSLPTWTSSAAALSHGSSRSRQRPKLHPRSLSSSMTTSPSRE